MIITALISSGDGNLAFLNQVLEIWLFSLYFWIHELSLAFGLILSSFDKFANFHSILFKLNYMSNLICVQMLCDDQNLGNFSLQDNIKDKGFSSGATQHSM